MRNYQFIILKHNHQVEIDYTAGKILSQSKSIIIRMSSSQKMRLESYLKRHNIPELVENTNNTTGLEIHEKVN